MRSRSAPTSPSSHCGGRLGHIPHLDSLPGNGEAGLLCQVGGSVSCVGGAYSLRAWSPSLGFSVFAVVSEAGRQGSEKWLSRGKAELGPELSPML